MIFIYIKKYYALKKKGAFLSKIEFVISLYWICDIEV